VVYDVVDVTDWPVLSQESGGAEAKDWITPPELAKGESREHWWLYKPVKLGVRGATSGRPSTYRRHDDEAERIACSLAQLIGVPSADVELARSSEGEGIISRNVTPDGWSIQGGDEILSELPGLGSPVRRIESVTIWRISAASLRTAAVHRGATRHGERSTCSPDTSSSTRGSPTLIGTP
jgi:hypothetical protein